jgi:hypothetical protein
VSPSPTELPMAGTLRHLRAWPRNMGRSLRRVLGASPQHTLFVHSQGVWAWTTRHDGVEPMPPSVHENVDAWCAAHEGADARIVVSNHLVHSLLVDAALPLDDNEALHTHARQQLFHYHGTPARHWPLAVWSDSRQRGACALHALDLDAVRRIAAAHEVHLRSVMPAWSVGLRNVDRQCPDFGESGRSALALVEAALVTWLVVDGGRVLQLQQRFADAAEVGALARLLRALMADSAPLAALPTVIGWGMDAAGDAASLPARVIGSLSGDSPSARWVLDGAHEPRP